MNNLDLIVVVGHSGRVHDGQDNTFWSYDLTEPRNGNLIIGKRQPVLHIVSYF